MYYVTMEDTILTDWGTAKNRIAVFVVKCDTLEEAEIAAENASYMQGMTEIKIETSKPQFAPEHYRVAPTITKEINPKWFTPHALKE